MALPPANEPEPTDAATLPVTGAGELVVDPDDSENDEMPVRRPVSNHGAGLPVEGPAPPHPLPEASNLPARHGAPERAPLQQPFRSPVDRIGKHFASGRTAGRDADFPRFGLTDPAPPEAVCVDELLRTADSHRPRAATTGIARSAYDFSILRDLRNTP